MTRVRDIERRFLESRGYNARFSNRNGWVWRAGRGRSQSRQEAFRTELNQAAPSERREIRSRLRMAV